LEPEHKVLSTSICDANAIAHVLNHIDHEYNIRSGSVTTLHPWLSYQNILDGAAKNISPDPNKYTPSNGTQNFGLGRASVNAIIPKKTTAVAATEKVLTQVKGKLVSHSFRVPTASVTCSDIVLQTEKNGSYEALKQSIEGWANQNQYVGLNYEPRISIDYQGEALSAIIDMQWLQFQNGSIKVIVWYDNEWGYCSRVLDLVDKVHRI
jgi:glyceraldehyde 3-phosphate dehydrogenase